MKHLKIFGLIFTGMLLIQPVIVKGESVYNTQGLRITVKDLKKKVGKYWKFHIKVRNSTGNFMKFEGRITLLQQSPGGYGGAGLMKVADCTVFKKIPAHKKISSISYCKGGFYSSWKFRVVRVYGPGGKAVSKKIKGVQTASTGGLQISVRDLKKKVGKYKKFLITVKNTSHTKKSFEGSITFYQPSPASVPNPPPMKVGSCVIFKKIPPKRKISSTSYCKIGFYNSWKFRVVRVYD